MSEEKKKNDDKKFPINKNFVWIFRKKRGGCILDKHEIGFMNKYVKFLKNHLNDFKDFKEWKEFEGCVRE